MIIAGSIEKKANTHPDKCAIKCDFKQISYNKLHKNIKEIQQKLVSIVGDPTGKKIGFLLDNNIDFLSVFLAVSSIGAISIPFDPKWSQDDLSHIISDCQPDLIINNQEIRLTDVKMLTFTELMKLENSFITDKQISSDSFFYIGYTSGTTGQPKGYIRTHSSWFNSFSESDEVFRINSEDIIFAPGSLVHSHFLYASIHALHKGATLYITKKFHANEVVNTLLNSPITVLYLVPTMFSAIYEEYKKTKKPFLALQTIISSGAKWHNKLKEKVKVMFPNAKIFEFYGASELSLISYLCDKGRIEKPESVGKPFPGVEILIRRSDGTKADINETGILFIKSKLIFSGYLNKPEATKEVFCGEWATVGDLAYLDADGYITLVGRQKNMIISGGLNIYPEEVEKVLFNLPAIEEISIIGVSDTHWGEKVIAVIKWKEGEKLSNQQLKQYCREKLASYKCPQLFLEVKAFPYTTSGKIARNEVLKLVQLRIEAEGKEVNR